MRKKVDERIRTLIENGVKARHRSMFVIIGDNSRDQIANLHYMLSKSVVKSRPSVLWCYKDKLQRNSHEKKCAKQIKKLKQWGRKLDTEKFDPLSLFFGTEKITYCLYKDSERILGNTFGMCILQDFEALTPNLLARTIETVEGGGLIVMLIPSLSSLTSLCTMVMDVHERFRTESHPQTTARFNERFLLSLASCKACIVMDDELNILPISSHKKSITQIPVQEDSEGLSEAQRELKDLKEELNDDFPVGPLIRKTCTMDQGKAVVTFLDSILGKSLHCTVALLAGRGRGKSAALGLVIAGAVAKGRIMLSSLSDVDPKLYEHVRELGDAEKARMCRTLGLNLNSLRLRELANASSCPQQKQKLMKLDTEIIVLAKLTMKYLSDVTKKDEFISHLHKASQWTIRTLNTLYKQLTPNLPQNQLKKSPSHSKMEHLHLQLVHLLINYHVIQEPEYDLSSEVDIDDYCFKHMLHSYQYCEAGDETLELIKKLRVIQQTTEPDVKKKIEDQIQLLKKLPIEQMCIQAEKLVKELGPMNENFDRFLGAQAFLIQTCNEITQICNIFAETSIKEHASNGVEQILQLLVNKVVAFEEKWKQEHAPFITPSLISFDRSEPKRQKIEQPIHGMSRSLHSRTDGNRSMLLT